MAPSRKRGASKAAAAAAACRQWNVGDLVLAKVKGFPAWPATVSEPEKWGYAADWKKVLVYFFGTQQIAFCNPADVEAFTEEKKQSLLGKRQGKGADFVRAVHEIIESYENSKKQVRLDGLNLGEEVAQKGRYSIESSAHVELKDQLENSEATVTNRNDSILASGIALDLPCDSLHDKEASLEQPSSDIVVVTAKPGITTYTSRKRSGGLRPRKRATQQNNLSVGRPQSLSRLEPCKFQYCTMCPDEGNKSSGNASANAILCRSTRRNKKIRKSLNILELDDVDSSAFVSNGSVQDNGSEIVTVDSDSLSQNEGSTIDSASKPEFSETLFECSEGDVELSKGLDFQINSVVAKRKRNLKRKRVTNESTEPPTRLEMEVYLDAQLHNNCQKSGSACEDLNEMDNGEDGDKHLPLVKRARVRMNKLSCSEEHESCHRAEENASAVVGVNLNENISFCQVEEATSNDAPIATIKQIVPSTNLGNDCSPDKVSVYVNETVDDASYAKAFSQIPTNRQQFLVGKGNQSFGCLADGEATLPPSKRLHRALEAMSANVADEGHAYDEKPTVKTPVNDDLTALSGSCMVMDRNDSNGSEEQSAESCGYKASAISCPNMIFEESMRSPLDVEICREPSETSASDRHQGNALRESLGIDNGQDFNGSCLGGRTKNTESKDIESENPSEDLHISGCSHLSSLLPADEATVGKSLNGSDVLQYPSDHCGSENAETSRSQVDENSQVNGMCEESKDTNYEQRQKDSCFIHSSDDHLGGRVELVVQSGPVPADGLDTPPQISPPSTSVCHLSTSESANFMQNGGYPSPNHSQQKTTFDDEEIEAESVVPGCPKNVGKWSGHPEAHTALSSFEGIIGSLTRTKDSIGRATRIAIDCAKFGVSSKVVDILARSLESESSSHRRVDLFFLVDSIAQYSRGLKGDVCDLYTSAIQAVLPRLISAAAPTGSLAQENRRQCLKVLRVWLERRILPESVIRHHMRELDSLGVSSSAGAYSRRSARTERPLDDPVREMEGMLVDEYGSNSSFQLPGFCMPCMRKDEDEGSDSDGESFEAVTPEHNNSVTLEEHNIAPAIEKHTHILENVDGELEMEDVAPSCEVEASCAGDGGLNELQNYKNQLDQHYTLPFAPPQEVPTLSAPLPPPPLPPPPPGLSSSGITDCYVNGIDPKHYMNSHDLHDDLRESAAQQSAAPRMSDGAHFHGNECRNQMQMQFCNSTSSFSSYHACPVNNVHPTDGHYVHHKAYPPRPPYPPPDHFSYGQARQHARCRRSSPPPPYHRRRFHSSYNTDVGNFYSNHERIRLESYDENWGYPPSQFHGPRYPDKSYELGPYGASLREPTRMPQQGWSFPHHSMHRRNFMRFRPPPSESAVPVCNRAASIWRPR